MRKINLEFIGEIVSSPRGMCSWSGTTIYFWGKFKKDEEQGKRVDFKRENLIEALEYSEERPSKEHFQCGALQVVPEHFLYLEK